ncbi:AMP-binding protein [Thermoplasma sp.]|uniref:AMP-binding protein n=1 Tax=Thermoplasma sp. TaxID=1973142 RepID=UPI0026369AD5|nr:AMP-binding protein [Thermoplasma sp.]
MNPTNVWYRWWPIGLPYSLEYPRASLYKIFEHRAEEHSDRDFIVFYDRRLRYADVLKEVKSLSSTLMDLGIQKGDRVGIYLQNSPNFAISLLAISRSGGIAVFMNPMLKRDEIRNILEDSKPKIIITSGELLNNLSEAREMGIKIIAGNLNYYLPEKSSVNVPDFMKQTYDLANAIRWDEAVSTRNIHEEVATGPDDPLIIAYTSGTTGIPKGCLHTNRSVIANAMASSYWRNTTPSTVELAVAPFFHVTGLSFSLLSPIYSGSELVIMTRWNKFTFLDMIEKYHVTHVIVISTMIADLLTVEGLEKRDFSSLRFIGGGGTPIPKALAEKFERIVGLPFVEGYGMTEAMGQSHVNPPGRRKLQCIGVPQFGYDARIIDVETGQDITGKGTGEIVISGPSLFSGYYNKPDETEKATIILDGKKFVRTGDIGYMDDEGYFFVVDRLKRMINRSGFKVWPMEVDSLLYNHPAVKEACVVGVPDERVGEEVKALVVLKPDYRGKVRPEEIIEWSKKQLASYKYPRIVEFVDELPKTPSGKIDWRSIQEAEKNRVRMP